MSLLIGGMEEEKPEEGSRAASLSALVKGFLPKLSLEDFPVEPEKAETASVPACVAERKGHKTRGSNSFEVGSSKDWNRSQGADFEPLGFLQKIPVEKETQHEDRGKDRATCVARFETNGAWQGMFVKASNGCEWTKACKEASSEDS